jgi:hypothetical protein
MEDSEDDSFTPSPYLAGLFRNRNAPKVRKPVTVNIDNPLNTAAAYPSPFIGIDSKETSQEKEHKFPVKMPIDRLDAAGLIKAAPKPGSVAARAAARRARAPQTPKPPVTAYRLGVDAAPGREMPLAEYEVHRPSKRRPKPPPKRSLEQSDEGVNWWKDNGEKNSTESGEAQEDDFKEETLQAGNFDQNEAADYDIGDSDLDGADKHLNGGHSSDSYMTDDEDFEAPSDDSDFATTAIKRRADKIRHENALRRVQGLRRKAADMESETDNSDQDGIPYGPMVGTPRVVKSKGTRRSKRYKRKPSPIENDTSDDEKLPTLPDNDATEMKIEECAQAGDSPDRFMRSDPMSDPIDEQHRLLNSKCTSLTDDEFVLTATGLLEGYESSEEEDDAPEPIKVEVVPNEELED